MTVREVAFTPSADRLRANLGMLLTICVWGAFFPVLERLLVTWDAYSATLGRQACSLIALYAVVLADRRRAPLPRLIAWRRILLLGLMG